MISFRRPDEKRIRSFLTDQARKPLSYSTPGMIRGPAPRGFVVDHNRTQLGTGEAVFDRAGAALRRWEMFRLGWVELCFPDAPIAPGKVVGVLARALGLWSLNACRVLDVVDEEGPIRRFGFTYATLPGHAECGEERFLIEWDRASGAVFYDILAYSRPNHWVARWGKPVTRRMQKRFARDSMAAMRLAAAAKESGKAP